MPVVRIDMWSGRGREVKDALIRNVTKAVVDAVGCPVDAVDVLIFETDKADWGKGGVSFAQREAQARPGSRRSGPSRIPASRPSPGSPLPTAGW